MKSLLIILHIVLLSAMSAKAQFITSGKIEYERKINIHAQMEEMEDNEWIQKIKSQMPKFTSAYFDMVFDTGRVSYKPGRESPNPIKMFGNGPATENIVYTDLTGKHVKSMKTVYEQKFLVQDTLRTLKWKEKDEIRMIAGYKCHKAVSIICDSVYVVAFYAEDLPVTGGPEMFCGLPGMILELAVPRLHTTWVATKVEQKTLADADFVIPEKGKKVTQDAMQETIKESFKSWGKSATRNMWWTVL
ncbi:GLPGLI family protein [Flavipsychrobacter stenotrophus]|nr:GLPGLI family protein [Flavipsychrobacter stenotrophus]